MDRLDVFTGDVKVCAVYWRLLANGYLRKENLYMYDITQYIRSRLSVLTRVHSSVLLYSMCPSGYLRSSTLLILQQSIILGLLYHQSTSPPS